MDSFEDLTKLQGFRQKVSSVLNKSQEYSGKNMFDGKEDSCWNSEAGSPQYIYLDFGQIVGFIGLEITFQGGFVGQDGFVEVGLDSSNLELVYVLDSVEDNNAKQTFKLCEAHDKTFNGRYMKITFPRSTDFYGRITVYSLRVLGKLIP